MLTRSRDPELQGHLLGLLDLDDMFVWPAAVFDPVAVELERVLDTARAAPGRLAVAA